MHVGVVALLVLAGGWTTWSPQEASPSTAIRVEVPERQPTAASLASARRAPEPHTPAPGAFDRESIRRAWRHGADASDPVPVIERLRKGLQRLSGRSAEAALARDAVEDLERLRERGERGHERFAESPESSEDRIARLDATLRYSGSDEEIRTALHSIASERRSDAADAILDAPPSSEALLRRAAITAIWRMAADGVADERFEDVLDFLDRARFGATPVEARLAERALEDLEGLD